MFSGLRKVCETAVAANEELLTAVSSKLADINQRVGQAEQDKKARDAFKAAQERLPTEEKALNEAEFALNVEKANSPECDALRTKIIEMLT